MALEFTKPEGTPTVNALLYGPGKSGKSMGAGSAPGPILYMNADLPEATRLVHATYGDKIQEVEVKSLDTLIAVAGEVQAHPDAWGTVVFDTVGDGYRRVIEDMSNRAMRPKINEYGDTGTHIERFCRAMCEAPVNFVAVCHELRSKNEETGGFESLPFTGTNNPALGAKLTAMVDVFGYTVAQADPDDDEKPPTYVAQLIDAKGRRGGDRFNVLGLYRPVNLTEWFDEIAKATSSKPVAAAA